MLAVMCQYGFAPVPEFRDRYRASPDEPPADHLCGVWSVGSSTFYRYVEKGKQQLAQVLLGAPLEGSQRVALRRFACLQAERDGQASVRPENSSWHAEQLRLAVLHRDAASALWHCAHTNDFVQKFVDLLSRFGAELAGKTEVDALMAGLPMQQLDSRSQADLLLAQAGLWRARGQDQRELDCLQQAVRVSGAAEDLLMQGAGYGALGKYYEVREPERALACYSESAEALSKARPSIGSSTDRWADEYAKTLVRFAWLELQKHNPQGKRLLEQAQAIADEPGVPEATRGLLEKAWSEHCRRSGDPGAALQHLHHALNIYERLDDSAQIASVKNNLGCVYREAGDFDQSFVYLRQLVSLADAKPVDPSVLASARSNLGANHFALGQYSEAIDQYSVALEISTTSDLQSFIARIRSNLAEAYYKRFSETRNADDERTGDANAAAAYKVWVAEKNAPAQDAIRNLKRELLGARSGSADDRLIPEEFVAHFAEFSEVQRHRADLTLPSSPESQISARIAIAGAYLAIAAKEREAARALANKHQLDDRFAAEFGALRATFNRELTHEERSAAAWQESASDLLNDERRAAVLAELFCTGAISKSSYANACAVSLATASKHLGLLSDRGLLVQSGRGPSTRYALPKA